MRRIANKFVVKSLILLLIMVSLVTGARPFLSARASAAYMGTRFLKMSNSKEGASGVTYDVSFTTVTPSTVGSIDIEFCSNSTLINEPCTAPVGLDASATALTSQSGMTGFSIAGASTANDIILTRTAAAAGAVTADYVFNNITNPTNDGTYYVRVITYQTVDATGPPTDNGGMAIAINPTASVKLTIPPYLLFCSGITITGTNCSTVAGDFIELGNFSASKTSTGQSQLVVATNGKSGYNITVNGTTMESGNNLIPAMNPAAPATTGVSQFGINLRANGSPSVGQNPFGPGIGTPAANYNAVNQFHYSDGDVIASSTSPEDLHKFTISYIVDVNPNQAVGIYASTFTYVATANF